MGSHTDIPWDKELKRGGDEAEEGGYRVAKPVAVAVQSQSFLGIT